MWVVGEIMKTDKINRNYAAVYQQNRKAKADKTAFTGSNVSKQITELLPQKKSIKIMEKMKWFDGEHGRILLTALGTGAIAPLFIAWNPYVKPKPGATEEEKKDLENTKKYTAMRQPISAVLQIIFQLSLLTPLYKGLDAIFNNPNNSKFIWKELDKSALQDDKYVERQVIKDLKNSKQTFTDKNAYKEEVERLKKAKIDSQIKQVADKLQTSGQIHINGNAIDNKVTAEIFNDTVNSYIKKTKKLRIDSKGQDFYAHRAEVLINNKKEITDVLKHIPDKDSEIADYLKQKLETTKNEDVKEIYKEIIDYPENLRASRSQRTIARISKIESMCDGSFTKKKYLQAMRNDYDMLTDVIENMEKLKIKDVSKSTPEMLKEQVAKLSKLCTYDAEKHSRIFGNTAVFHTDSSKLLKKIYIDITKGYKGVVNKKYRAFKEFAGITIGLFITTPITCTALNWVYPRFMEIFFPGLTGNQKAKEKAKLAALQKNGGEK